ncbi:hypothetical protein E4U58_000220 [Claviceps cyperi]|nr:hypothetical protein E4U58_000220 [Claviceps cyperi]
MPTPKGVILLNEEHARNHAYLAVKVAAQHTDLNREPLQLHDHHPRVISDKGFDLWSKKMLILGRVRVRVLGISRQSGRESHRRPQVRIVRDVGDPTDEVVPVVAALNPVTRMLIRNANCFSRGQMKDFFRHACTISPGEPFETTGKIWAKSPLRMIGPPPKRTTVNGFKAMLVLHRHLVPDDEVRSGEELTDLALFGDVAARVRGEVDR